MGVFFSRKFMDTNSREGIWKVNVAIAYRERQLFQNLFQR